MIQEFFKTALSSDSVAERVFDAISGGLPVGFVGGRADIMDLAGRAGGSHGRT